jgi:hypothetical protein
MKIQAELGLGDWTYIAGSCMPLFAPDGCRPHKLLTKRAMLDSLAPQYLHSYFDFSLPS